MSTTRYIRPTESELEILQVLWAKQTASVRDVHEELSKTKEAGYYYYFEADADHA